MMKGSEITKQGFYWCRSPSERDWAICRIEGDTFYYGVGTDEFEDFPFVPGVLADATFVGPIEPPTDLDSLRQP